MKPRAEFSHPWRLILLTILLYGTLSLLVILALCACGSPSRVSRETLPDTVALHPIHLPAVDEPSTTAQPSTTVEVGLAPVSADAVAVRLDPPPTTSSTLPPPVWTTYDCESFRPLFEEAGLDFEWFGTVVMPRESHCDPLAFRHDSRDWSFGLMQINTIGANWGELQWRCGLTVREDLFDPVTNLRCAAALFAAYGRTPWLTG